MNNPRFYSPILLAPGISTELPASAARHAVRVLRLQIGDALTLFDGSGSEFPAHIASITREKVVVYVLAGVAVNRESPLSVTLVQALQAGEKMDWTVQKAVELGVTRIIPVQSRRSVVRLAGERAQRRVEHWQAVAASACEQCGRNRVPEIAELDALERYLSKPALPGALRLMLSPDAMASLASVPSPAATTPIEILIGCEGGLAPEEMELASLADFIPLRLGPRVLRTETAGLAVLAAMQVLWGDWRG